MDPHRRESHPHFSVSVQKLNANLRAKHTQNFEICSSRKQWDSLSQLSSFVGRQVFELKDEQAAGDGEPARSLALEVLRRVALGNARMIAGWQAVGFMHGGTSIVRCLLPAWLAC